ncbi:MAG: cell division protein FtsA [candidate division Zixibacteria bacterium]|nr:cell division protein FtsA [candidate division Zixibacteria bacterium]
MAQTRILTGLDIGTTKIAAIIAEIGEADEPPRLIGLGMVPSEGLRRGVVVDLEKTVRAIAKAVSDAELMAGLKVDSVIAGLSGDHVRSINSHGVIAVARSDREITELDVERVIEAARAVAIPADREIIHVLPQEYIIDEQTGIKVPVGMSGVRLETEVHIVTAAATAVRNIYRAINRCEIEVEALVLEALASSYALVGDEEQELGVAVIDIGGSKTDIAVFFDGSIRHTSTVPLGGKNVTNDIAIGLRTPIDQADDIKMAYGAAMPSMVNADEMISVPGIGGRGAREISRHVLASIIGPRMEEIFTLVQREVKKANYSDTLAAGVVLTGGGSLLPGSVELAEQIFDMPVKVGIPRRFEGLSDMIESPVHAAGVGLIQYGLTHADEMVKKSRTMGMFKRMEQWFNEHF